jgi:hypothetical protein
MYLANKQKGLSIVARYKQAEDKRQRHIENEILLHKDKKENMEIATAQMAHLVFADTQPNAEKTKRAIS